MNLLKELTKKNLILNKKRTIVTIIGIMLSVALLTAVSSMYTSAIDSITSYEKHEMGDFHVSFYGVDNDGINKIKQNRTIDNIYYTKDLGYAKISSKNEYKPYAHIVALNENALKKLSIKLVSGRFPTKDNEILVPTHLKTNGRMELHIDDEIELNVGTRYNNNEKMGIYEPYMENEQLKDTTNKKYKVVGIIERPATNIESFDNPGYSFITYLDKNEIKDNVNVYIRFTKEGLSNKNKVISDILNINEKTADIVLGNAGKYTIEELKEANEEFEHAKYSIDVNSYLMELELDPINNSTFGDFRYVIAVVCLIIVVTSTFCIKNSFDISITEKIKQYGMLRSIGATKKQIRKNVFYEATLLGLIGIPLGILLGSLASFILVIVSNHFLNDMISDNLTLQFSFSLIAIIVSIVLGIITIYISAIRSALKAAKVSPIESIRNSGEIKIKRNKIKAPKLVSKIFGIGGEISYKNLKRNRKKYRTTTLSLIISVTIFIALSYFMSLALDSVDDEIKTRDYNLTLSCRYDKECEKKAMKTLSFDNVDKYTIFKMDVINLKDNKVNKKVEEKFDATYQYYDEDLKKEVKHSEYERIEIVAVGEEEYKRYLKELKLNYDESYDKGILFDTIVLNEYNSTEGKNKSRYKIYDYVAGDKINFSYTLDNGKEKNDSIELIKTTDLIPFGLKDRIYNSTSSFMVISDKKYNELFERDSFEKIIYLSSDADKLQDDIEKYLEQYEIDLRNINESVKQMENLFILLAIFLYGFITVITLIGITNIFNTITTSVYLRKREFAMLKSIGMTTKEFNRMIRLESIFMGVRALLFSIPIGIILSYLIYIKMGKSMGMLYHIPMNTIILSICTVFILIMLIMKYSVNKVNKQNIIETIRNENI